jgi:hypothetical protein
MKEILLQGQQVIDFSGNVLRKLEYSAQRGRCYTISSFHV